MKINWKQHMQQWHDRELSQLVVKTADDQFQIEKRRQINREQLPYVHKKATSVGAPAAETHTFLKF
ncbi:hypothetical protein ACNAN0_02350 [Agrilactobacillus fermenti]|uniref:hypothetical protein n=1 Tax=Agrilactobacillus fermenti TaxID=2586909 RepID=UPI001E3F4685|nr:hypothetical protein [Agrilactobacillus fermenti]MCD2257110.1 hypothetical protein [Agrilactobacillus fermenti]